MAELTYAPWIPGPSDPVRAESAGGNLGLSLREHLDNQEFMRQKLLQSSIENAAQMQQQSKQFGVESAERQRVAEATEQLRDAQLKSLDTWRQAQEQEKRDKAAELAKQHEQTAALFRSIAGGGSSSGSTPGSDYAGEIMKRAPAENDPGDEASGSDSDQGLSLSSATPLPAPSNPAASLNIPSLLAQYPAALENPRVGQFLGEKAADARASMVQDRIDKRSKETQAAIAAREKASQAAKNVEPLFGSQVVDGETIHYVKNPQTGHFQILSKKNVDQAKNLQFKLTGIDGQIAELSKVADKTTTQENHLTRLQSDRAGLLAQLMALTNTPPASAPAATPTGTATPKKLTYDPTTDTLK